VTEKNSIMPVTLPPGANVAIQLIGYVIDTEDGGQTFGVEALVPDVAKTALLVLRQVQDWLDAAGNQTIRLYVAQALGIDIEQVDEENPGHAQLAGQALDVAFPEIAQQSAAAVDLLAALLADDDYVDLDEGDQN